MEISATSLPPADAMGFWADKVPMGKKEYLALEEEARSRAFFVSGLAKGDLLQAVKDSLGEALAQGTSFAQWKKTIAPQLEQAGWLGNAHRLQTIFRTNMQSAYMAGRYTQQLKSVALRPYWQMSGVNDDRTRPSHAALHGVVYPADHEFWDTYYPPNGYLCRCTVKSLSERQVEQQELEVQRGPVDHLREHPEYGLVNTRPDYGFDRNIGKDWWSGVRDLPDPDRHPEAYAEAEKHPPKNTKRPPKVASYEALGKELSARCGKFMTHSNPVSVKFDRGRYFMATYSDGRLLISSAKHTTIRGTFNAAAELKDGWNAIAAGKQLTWKQEYAFESLWHEIMHNRQVVSRNMHKGGPAHVLMETVNQWTSRRTYQEFLRSLGVKPLHQKEIIKEGLGYGHWVRNFDTLLGRLGLQDADVLKAIRAMHETKPRDSYLPHLAELLHKKNAAIKADTVQNLLAGLRQDEEAYKKLLDDLIKG